MQAFVGMLIALIFGMSMAFLSLLFLLERGLFYLAIPYCSGVVGADSGGVYDQLDLAFDGSFNDLTPTGGVDYLDMIEEEPIAVTEITGVDYDPTPRHNNRRSLPPDEVTLDTTGAAPPAFSGSAFSIPNSNIELPPSDNALPVVQDSSMEEFTAPDPIL